MRHQDFPLGQSHIVETWQYADAAARTGASGFDSLDVGKLALQLDTGTVYRLTATTPTWAVWGGTEAGASESYVDDAVSAEADEREADDTALGILITDEATDRETADTTLDTKISQALFGRRLPKSGAYTLLPADKGSLVVATTGTWSLSLTAAATLGDNFAFGVYNQGSGVITIDPDGSETIEDYDGSATTKTLAQGEGCIVMCDGTGFIAFKIAAPGAGGSSDSADITYDPTASGLTSTDVQAAIDELADALLMLSDPDAAAVDYDPSTSGLAATNVQDAIDEIASASGGGGGVGDTLYLLDNFR